MPRLKKGYGIRSKDAVVDERVAEMLTVLANRPNVHKSILHREFTQRWNCHWRTVDRFVARARQELLLRLGRSKEEFRADSLAFYEAMGSDPKASVSEKTRARQRIDELLGLDAPKRTEVSGPEGGPIDVSGVATEYDMAAIDKALAAHYVKRNEQPKPHPAKG